MAKRYAQKDPSTGRYVNPATGAVSPGATVSSPQPTGSAGQPVSMLRPAEKAYVQNGAAQSTKYSSTTSITPGDPGMAGNRALNSISQPLGLQPTSMLRPEEKAYVEKNASKPSLVENAYNAVKNQLLTRPDTSNMSAQERANRDALSMLPVGGIKYLKAVPGVARAGIVTTEVAAKKLYEGGINNLLEKLLNKGSTKIVTSTNLVTGKVRQVAINSKTAELTAAILAKKFSVTALAVAGAWAGSMFLGQWAQAESTEPISINMNKYLIPNAQNTGNWSLVQEAQIARDEILDLEFWEKAAMWSPAAPLVGIINKIKGAIEGAKITDKIIEDLKIQQETGETDDAKWQRVSTEEKDSYKKSVDYFNAERKKLLAFEEEARAASRLKEAEFWAREKERQRNLEEEERIAIAEFWLAYKRESQKIASAGSNNSASSYSSSYETPSKLTFGLL